MNVSMNIGGIVLSNMIVKKPPPEEFYKPVSIRKLSDKQTRELESRVWLMQVNCYVLFKGP